MASAASRTLSKSIKGSVTLVTGAKSGFGKATAEYFLENGSKVIKYDLPYDYGIVPPDKKNCIYVAGDVRNEDQVAVALKRCKDTFGRLDYVINCAGVSLCQKTFIFKQSVMFSNNNFHHMLSTNVSGRFNVIRQAVGLMKENEPDENGQRGVIINMSGAPAMEGMAGQVGIAACDGAVASMTLPLSRDLADVGIRAVTIAPGFFESTVTAAFDQKAYESFRNMIQYPRRYGEPMEFAAMCKTVCENPMLNGETVRLDGALRLPF